MSLSPSYWGPPIWTAMYTIAYVFPTDPTTEHCENVATYYTVLADLLPCEECREHYQTFLKDNPIRESSSSRESLLIWVNGLHNMVNELVKSPIVSLAEKLNEMDKSNEQRTKPDSQRRTAVSFGIRRPVGKSPRFDKRGCSNCP